MRLDEECRLSFYQQIASLNEDTVGERRLHRIFGGLSTGVFRCFLCFCG